MPFTSYPSMNLFDTVTHRNTYDSFSCACLVHLHLAALLAGVAFDASVAKSTDEEK